MNIDKYKSDRASVWWHAPDGPKLELELGIFRLLVKNSLEERDVVIFDCVLPRHASFLHNVNGRLVEVRYINCGRLDNYLAGYTLFYLRSISVKDYWVNNLAVADFGIDPQKRMMRTRIHAYCNVDMVAHDH